jgi:myo-inositol-1(or 4)-monophosphatase
MEENKYLEFAISTSKEAGKIVMDNYGKFQKLNWDKKTNFKIELDNKIDQFIRKKIRKNFPGHNIYSEEEKFLDNKSNFSWVIDPLDGTIPYTFEISDHFSISICLVENKTPILGVIFAPKRNELYYAEINKGAFCNDIKIKTSSNDNINQVLMGIDHGKSSGNYQRDSISKYISILLKEDGISNQFNSACSTVPLCLTAKGNMNAFLSPSLEPWDMAAAVIINREAGNKVTNLEGKEWELGHTSILVANPNLHNLLLNLIK